MGIWALEVIRISLPIAVALQKQVGKEVTASGESAFPGRALGLSQHISGPRMDNDVVSTRPQSARSAHDWLYFFP